MFKDESSWKMKLGILETWDNGPVGKAAAIQTWEPGFDPQYLCKKPDTGAHTYTPTQAKFMQEDLWGLRASQCSWVHELEGY